MTFDGMEYELKNIFKTLTEKRIAKINFIRYADDFIITRNSKELLEKEIKPVIENFLQKRGLKLSEEKTNITINYLSSHLKLI